MVTANQTSDLTEDPNFELLNTKRLLLQAKSRQIKARVQKISRLDGIVNFFMNVINQGEHKWIILHDISANCRSLPCRFCLLLNITNDSIGRYGRKGWSF